MIEELKELMKEFLADEEIFPIVAKAMMRMKREFVIAGFTEDQAMQMLVAHGFGFNANKN